MLFDSFTVDADDVSFSAVDFICSVRSRFLKIAKNARIPRTTITQTGIDDDFPFAGADAAGSGALGGVLGSTGAPEAGEAGDATVCGTTFAASSESVPQNFCAPSAMASAGVPANDGAVATAATTVAGGLSNASHNFCALPKINVPPPGASARARMTPTGPGAEPMTPRPPPSNTRTSTPSAAAGSSLALTERALAGETVAICDGGDGTLTAFHRKRKSGQVSIGFERRDIQSSSATAPADGHTKIFRSSGSASVNFWVDA